MNGQFDRQLFERMALAVDSQHRARQGGNEFPAAYQIVAQMNRERRDDETRLLQSARSERLRHERIAQSIERSHDPRLIHQIDKLDTTTSCPLALLADDQRVSVIEENLRIQLLGETTLHRVTRQPGKDQIDLTFVEFRKLHCRRVHRHDMKSYARIVS